jgi:tetratricopeptide (TPR) repeat protein
MPLRLWKRYYAVLFYLCALPVFLYAQKQQENTFGFYEENIDNNIGIGKIDIANALIEAEFRNALFTKDSAQAYFFKSRKMEVNYYYDLGKLGLIDAKKNLKWAMQKNNATMIMDCCNFIGLFNFMLGKLTKSIECYKKGLSYLRFAHPLPYTTSKAFHLQNNLAEAFLKNKEFDSAMKYCELALEGAIAEDYSRMQALSVYQIGDVYREKGMNTKADSLLQSAIIIAQKNGYTDVTLVCLGSLGQNQSLTLTQRGNYIDQGFQLLKQDSTINPFYTKDFLKHALHYFELTKNYAAQADVLRRITTIEDKKKTKELNYLIRQYDEVIAENEKRIALEKSNLQKSKEVQLLIIITAIVSILVLTAALIIVFLRVKRKNTILNIRSAISRDLHDDLGFFTQQLKYL